MNLSIFFQLENWKVGHLPQIIYNHISTSYAAWLYKQLVSWMFLVIIETPDKTHLNYEYLFT